MWEVAVAVATAMLAARSTKQAQESSEKVPKGAIDSYVEKYGDEILSLSRAQLVLLQAEAEVNAEIESLAICGELWATLARDWQEIRYILHNKEEAKILRDKEREAEYVLYSSTMESMYNVQEKVAIAQMVGSGQRIRKITCRDYVIDYDVNRRQFVGRTRSGDVFYSNNPAFLEHKLRNAVA